MDTECGNFVFVSSFDSGNLGRVEQVVHTEPEKHDLDFEFNIWTRPDCAGTEFENGNRTWFYFGIRGGVPHSLVKLNIMNLNKQSKMYAQGMTPVFRIVPGRPRWERIRDKPSFSAENNEFVLSFKQRMPDTFKSTIFFAFTYPFSYIDCQTYLSSLETLHKFKLHSKPVSKLDDIYYLREVLCYSLDKRRVDLITISSYHNMTSVREPRLLNLFPDITQPRPFKFNDKKVVFLSARVHPGETPSSFVLNGMLSMLCSRENPSAQLLRKHFVFKIIPMLNPDGVCRGNYRTDSRGVNLNRVYGNPSPKLHPSIFGARAVLLYCHHGHEVVEEYWGGESNKMSHIEDRVLVTVGQGTSVDEMSILHSGDIISMMGLGRCEEDKKESGIYLYIDMHGHASKKGIFMYGNHFEDTNDNVECMLLPKLISLNSQHFQFESCNFSEKNMYLKDRKDGSSREGCGRVAVLKATGLVRSYTLECNYNTGKVLNQIPPTVREPQKPLTCHIIPPKYCPPIFEEVGKCILTSILDLMGMNPNTRLGNSVYRNITGVKDWIRNRLESNNVAEVRLSRSGSQILDGLRVKRSKHEESSGRSLERRSNFRRKKLKPK